MRLATFLMKRVFQRDIIAVIIIASGVVLLSTVIIMALTMRPVADDYSYFSDPLIHNPIRFAIHYYMDWTGRSGQAFWVSCLYVLFGASSVIYGSILQIVLLFLSAFILTYTLLHKR